MAKAKKDLNYVANVEKAISEKYGKEAVQNPKSNWTDEKEKEYLQQLKEIQKRSAALQEKIEKIEHNGFFVSKKLINKQSNRTCPVCEVYSFEHRDDIYMNKYSCCFKCFINHVEDREERWLSGWRPSKKDDQKD